MTYTSCLCILLGLRATTLLGNNNRKEKRMKFDISLEELNNLTFGVEIETTIPRSSEIKSECFHRTRSPTFTEPTPRKLLPSSTGLLGRLTKMVQSG